MHANNVALTYNSILFDKNPEATAKAIDEYGWFDTSDLGRINPATADLILTERVKEAIVLSNGENIEPQPLEDAILGGSGGLLEQVMLTGQDGRRLVAIVVELANAGYFSKVEAEKLQKANEVVTTEYRIANNVAECHSNATGTGFARWEQVRTVHLTMEPFAMTNGQLTHSYKVKQRVEQYYFGSDHVDEQANR